MGILWPRATVLSPGASTTNVIQPTGAAVTPLIVKGATAQSATLQEWQNSSGTRLAQIDSAGGFYTSNIVDAAGANIRMDSDGSLKLRAATAPFIEFLEAGSAPAAGSANTGRLYCVDNGAGKTQLYIRFASGAAQLLATEP